MDPGRSAITDTDAVYRVQSPYNKQWNTTRSPHAGYNEGHQNSYDTAHGITYFSTSESPAFNLAAVGNEIPGDETSFYHTPRADQAYTYSPPSSYNWQPTSYPPNEYGNVGAAFAPYNGSNGGSVVRSPGLEGGSLSSSRQRLGATPGPVQVVGSGQPGANANYPRRHYDFSPPMDSVDDITNVSPSLSDLSMDSTYGRSPPPARGGSSKVVSSSTSTSASTSVSSTSVGMSGGGNGGRNRQQCRRGGNRDEFDGPHQFLPKPTQQFAASMQDRELPHLPTHLLVQEQDSVLSQVNDQLSRCAFDFVARYQFPIPLTQDMRPVSRPQDREWTEWVQLLKRLATKRRIPARVLYNGQIKQFVTILENSLEMRHAARHQSRPLKDDRNILQLISAGIQVAKILKDAPAMDFLDRLYVATDKQIQERSAAAAARFRT